MLYPAIYISAIYIYLHNAATPILIELDENHSTSLVAQTSNPVTFFISLII